MKIELEYIETPTKTLVMGGGYNKTPHSIYAIDDYFIYVDVDEKKHYRIPIKRLVVAFENEILKSNVKFK